MPLPQTIVPALAQALAKRGYDTLTPVQEAVLQPNLRNTDLIVSAQTGSGKTVAFGLAIASTLLTGEARFGTAGAPVALVIAPTRELAMQVKQELEWLFDSAGARVASCVGGMDSREERDALRRGAHIVVGTPGRLVDHLLRGALELSALRAVVLDEADEMMKLGFREELEQILSAAPEERRTLLFSATMPRVIETLAKECQRDAARINVTDVQKQHLDIEYRVLVTASHDVENALFNVLRYYDATNALVFCGTRAAVTRLTSRLANRGASVVALSGELSQAQRTHALQALRDHHARVCVATDVAARGLDLPDLDLVIHADLPKSTETLLHRSGRTGRAGRKGISALIVPHSARRRTERLLRDAAIQAKWSDPPSADDVRQRDDARLLGDPILVQPPENAEQTLVQRLLERHSPEMIAGAFVRLYRKGQSAPEDLTPLPPWSDQNAQSPPRRDQRPSSGSRANFQGGEWISLSIGRKKSAEPRWLIPMLCKAGGLTKRDIGSIQIEQHETHVEIDAARVDEFFANVGPDGLLEKSIRAVRMNTAPASGRSESAKKPRVKSGREDSQRPEGRAPKASASAAAKPTSKQHGKADRKK